MRKITLILFLIFLPVRKGRANLLEFPAGARARAMGYAYTSIADDGSAASWNPAGITGVSSPRIYFMHTPLWLDTFYNFISYHHPVKKLGTLGVSYCRIDSSGFVARSSLFEEPEEFSTAHQAFIISGAKQLAGKYHLGVNLKGVFSRIYETSAAGFGADIGFKYDINKAWDSGLTLKNIVPPVLKWNSENENYPLVLSLGSSYRYSRFLFSVNVKKKKNIPLRFGLGTEGEINRYLDLRAGWQDYPGIGLGVNWRQFTLNYSFLFHELGYNHTFDFTWRPAWIPGAGQMEKFSKRMAKKRADKYWEKGIEYYKQQKYEMALVEWEKALIWQPGNEKIQKRVSEVNKQLDVIVNRRLLEQHLTSAYKLYSSGKLKESLEEWQEVLVFDPGNSRAREYIEKIKDKLGEKEREKAEREMLLKR
ncbi:MAG: PorV/PorQ family protein, partial [Elusimicrobiota bacterium]|nr:PorV/PorQ family protein [Elusimicrobiota bacterium]